MYAYKWNRKTGGYTLVPQTGMFDAADRNSCYNIDAKR